MKAQRIRTLLKQVLIYLPTITTRLSPHAGQQRGPRARNGLEGMAGIDPENTRIPCSVARSMMVRDYLTSLAGWSMNCSVKLWSSAIPKRLSNRPLVHGRRSGVH